MSIKRAIIILIALTVISVLFFGYIFFLNYKSKDIKIDTSIPLSQEEIIEKKVDEKFEWLEESHSGRYTQDELEFIVNPGNYIKEEMGIAVPETLKEELYTKEELEKIANPDGNNLNQNSLNNASGTEEWSKEAVIEKLYTRDELEKIANPN